MAAPRLVKIDSIDGLRAAAGCWDDLWERSEVALPIARAELIAQWIEAAAPDAKLHAIAVEQDGQFVAALPLLHGRVKRFLRVGKLPVNNWSWAGDLLLDLSADLSRALELLASAIAQSPWPMLWFEGVAFDSPRWIFLADALTAAGLAVDRRERFQVGQIEISHDWPAYQASWSSNHRHQMKRMEKRARKEGELKLVIHREIAPAQIEPLLRRGFEVERSGWKGDRGTAVLNSPDVFQFYCRQATDLVRRGQLQLTFLELSGRPIAFEFGWNAKGVYCSPKVGYDEEFRNLTPGQLLRHQLLDRFFSDPQQRLFDFVGPLADATSKWMTRSYPVGRFVVAKNAKASRALLAMLRDYSNWKDRRSGVASQRE